MTDSKTDINDLAICKMNSDSSQAAGRYQSRNMKCYDDDLSHDEDEVEEVPTRQQKQAKLKRQNSVNFYIDGNKPNPRFKNYREQFTNLLDKKLIKTELLVKSARISLDSKRILAIMMKNDREYYVQQYDINSMDLEFNEKIGGKENSYIKVKQVEQDPTGKHYAIVYFDNGNFRLRTFG